MGENAPKHKGFEQPLPSSCAGAVALGLAPAGCPGSSLRPPSTHRDPTGTRHGQEPAPTDTRTCPSVLHLASITATFALCPLAQPRAGGKSCCSGMAGTEQPLFGFHFLEKQTLGGFTLHGRMPQSAGLGSAEGNEPEAGPRLHPSCELRCSPATTAPEHVPWEQHGSGICQSPCNKESRGGKTQMPRTCLHGSGCLGIASVLQNEGKKKKNS